MLIQLHFHGVFEVDVIGRYVVPRTCGLCIASMHLFTCRYRRIVSSLFSFLFVAFSRSVSISGARLIGRYNASMKGGWNRTIRTTIYTVIELQNTSAS